MRKMIWLLPLLLTGTATSLAIFLETPGGRQVLLADLAEGIRHFYIFPAQALIALFGVGQQSPGLADRFLIMLVGFTAFFFCFQVMFYLGGRWLVPERWLSKQRSSLSYLWTWIGNLCFSQIEFFISLGDSMRNYSARRIILFSALGFITLDLPLTVRYAGLLSVPILTVVCWKTISILSVVGWDKMFGGDRDFILNDPRVKNFEPESLTVGPRVAVASACCLGIVWLVLSIIIAPLEKIFFPGDFESFSRVTQASFIVFKSLSVHEAQGFDLLMKAKDHLGPDFFKVMGFWLLSFINISSIGLQLGALLVLWRRNALQSLRIVMSGFALALIAHLSLWLPLLAWYGIFGT